MAAANSDYPEGEATAARFWLRLVEGRWLIVAAAVVVAVLYLANAVAAHGAVLIWLGFAAAVALVPRARPVGRASAPAPTAPAGGLGEPVRLFADALPDPCFILDRRGIVRYANERAAATFPIGVGEALTFRLRVPDLVAAFDSVAKGGPPVRVEFSERVPTERWFAAWFARLGEGDLVVLMIDDMSERRNADRVRVDFVANASHELRTPLASLAGFVETLQGPARDDPKARERFLAIMREQAERMSRLVNDLLSLSRIEMKAHVRPSDRVDLGSVVSHVVDSLEPLARELGVAIETEVPAAPVMVIGDRDELTQVFENLIENACKYGQSGKRVVVAVAPAKDNAGPQVSVRDFGPGIPEEHQPRLTERFYRVDVEDSRRHRGTGLGLAIVKHTLARHLARLTVASRLGEGATFTVAFPQGRAADGFLRLRKIASRTRHLGCLRTVCTAVIGRSPGLPRFRYAPIGPEWDPSPSGMPVRRRHSRNPNNRRGQVKHINLAVAAGFAAVLSISAAHAADIAGAGSTFIYPVFSKWADTYKTSTGIGLNYQSIGSGGGIKQVEAKTVTFGATDKPLSDADLATNGLVQFPMVMGGIVPIVNIDGVKPGDLVLDGKTLAGIFLGTITKWDDPAITALNASLKLPSAAIVVVHRSDGSGTTFNFTDYLSKLSPDWQSQVGSDTAVEWPVGVGAKGSEGVANTVKQTQGGIGYDEYAYAAQNNLAYTKMVNAAGKVVEPSLDTFAAAAASADWADAKNFNLVITNQAGDTSWPIAATTWVLIHKQPDDTAAAGEALKFFDWAYKNGKDQAKALDYVAIPDPVVALIEKTWATDIMADGKAVFATE